MSNFRNERLLAAGLLGLAVVVLVAVPVLERSRGGEVVLRDKCDADCQQKAEMVQEQMKALRAQITGDYKSMVTFGTKVGYVPPPQSIRKEVMDGTLLGTGKGPAEPGDFDPTATVSPSASRGRKHKSFGSDAEKKLLASEEPSSVGGERSSSILPPVKTVLIAPSPPPPPPRAPCGSAPRAARRTDKQEGPLGRDAPGDTLTYPVRGRSWRRPRQA